MLFLLSLAFLYLHLGRIQIVWCLFCEFFICTESIALGNCANLASSIGSQTSGNISMCTTKATLLLYYYCPVVIMKKFVQLLLRFRCLKCSRQQADFLQCRLLSGNLVALFVNTGEREKQKPSQQSSFNKNIREKLLQRNHSTTVIAMNLLRK